MMSERGFAVGAAVLALWVGTAWAAEVVVEQQNKAFTPPSVTAQVGDTLTFTNGDLYTHNMFSGTLGHEFNLGGQNPGEKKSIRLTKAGTFEVECQIHPRMHLTVTVK
ncbi:cupredoxin domain-containing protein [Azospirillum griseum]|uniref:EfeO-type cupredoxin-like domain-containing protein n=1 Tax=Azospirillum griseum TaxID=2496639 RepID=A0A431VCG9_9PROT|nr:cupredoxin domain-containing protein [Azospirillum griseum]RTR16448.1 hypothetical protein EJ903_20855 [Azospirillum griseum]